MLVLLLCSCFIGYILWSKLLKVPEDAPPRISLIGNIKLFLTNTDAWTKYLRLVDLARKYNGVCYGTLGQHTIYVVSNPEDALIVLKSSAEKAFIYNLMSPYIGKETLFTGPANINKIHRKLFLPMISPRQLDSYIKDFDQHAKRFVPKMAARAGEPPFDILRYLLIYNIELLCTTLLGLPDLHKTYDFNPYCDSVATYLRTAIDKFQNLLYHNETIYSFSKLKKKQDEAVDFLHYTSTDLIKKRQQLYLKEMQERKDNNEIASEVYIDILAEAVKTGILTETEMREEIDTIIFGGHDTTAFTTLYAMALLGSYPEVQEKVYEEVQGILGKSKDVSITKDDLSKMIYLEACIKETLRLYPYGALTARRLDKDIKLRTCTLREGASVFVLVWDVHRHSSWGPDALEYRPERWLESDKLPRPTVLLGFSEGPRACTGRKYAMLSMKTLLAHLVREFKFRADDKQLEFEFVCVLEPKSGHHIALERRT